MEGKTIAHYRVLSRLGSGGMGVVYKAVDLKLGRFVALKLLPESLANNPSLAKRFAREANTASNLNHPNICTIYEIEEYDNRPCLVMEFLEGCTLKERLEQGPLSIPEIIGIGTQIVEALSAAEARDIVHRDVKPSNLFLTREGRVKLLDFGLAKEAAARQPERRQVPGTDTVPISPLTQPGQLPGTIQYMSPEQVRNEELDSRSDLFSLGVVLYEMVTGRKPFVEKTVALTYSAILSSKPARPSKFRKDIPSPLEDLILRLLQKNPGSRFQNAVELREALRKIPEQQNNDDEGRRVPARYYTIAAIPLIAASFVVWLTFFHSRDEDKSPKPEMQITQLTNQDGPEFSPSLSPDGSSFIYSGGAAGNFDIYLQKIGEGYPINLTPDSQEDDIQPAYSPDGAQIAFRSERNGGGIYVMSSSGKSVHQLCDFGYNPAWSPTGKEIAVGMESIIDDPTNRHGRSRLRILNLETGAYRELPIGDGVQPSWSPHGTRIAYWAMKGSKRHVFTVRVDGTSNEQVTQDGEVNWNPAWSADGQYLYFSSDRGGNSNLWRVRIDEETGKTGALEPVTNSAGSSQREHVAISRTGQHLVYVEEARADDMLRVEFDPQTGKPVGPPMKNLNTTTSINNPNPSPDGRKLVYQTWGGLENLVVINADGSGKEVTLTKDTTNRNRVPRWSPDGEWIAFYSNRGGTYQMYAIHPDGTGLRQITHDPDINITRTVWSPDSRKLAGYNLKAPNSHGETGSFIITLDDSLNEEARERLPAFTKPGFNFNVWTWSPDGQWIAGMVRSNDTGDTYGFALYSPQTHTYQNLLDFGDEPSWLHDGRRLVFTNGSKLEMVDRVTGRVNEILSVFPNTAYAVGELPPDDRFIYFIRESREADIWMISPN